MTPIKLNIMDVSLFKVAVSFIFIILLSACSAGNDSTLDGVEESTDDVESVTLSLTATDETGDSFTSLTQGDSATFTVSAINAETENAIVGVQIDLTTTTGELSVTSILTDDTGVAQITYNSSTATSGVNTITASSTLNDEVYTQTFSFNVLDTAETNIQIGYLDDDNVLIENTILTNSQDDTGETSIDAGSTVKLTLHILDDDLSPITDSVLVTFDSNCVQAGTATIDSEVFSINGVVNSTYQDLSCATASGNDDIIVATMTINSEEYQASVPVSISPESVASIEFVSAIPESIVLKGTGGQDKKESSTLTFLVKSELDNVLAQQDVNFSLSSTAGGLSLVSESGVTNSEGLVTAKVLSGTAPTPVRVTASITENDNTIVSTQSDLLSVNTGLPDQDSFTIALSEPNPEARNRIGKQVEVVAYLADSTNNRVPDGTTVNFTAEGGTIESSCNTVGGTCTVTWTSTAPFVNNNRITILATAIGHETFVDTNGNNIFDDEDGGINTSNFDSVYSGLNRSDNELFSGFIDMPEPWRDDNENNIYDSGERTSDFNGNETYDSADGLFNGPQCESETFCPDPINNLTFIRKAVILITSSSSAYYTMTHKTTSTVLAKNYDTQVDDGELDIAFDTIQYFSVEVSDTALQTMSVGTTIAISSLVGELSGTLNHTVINTIGTTSPDDFGGKEIEFSIRNNLEAGDDEESGTVTLTITSPSGVQTIGTFLINLKL